MRVAVFVQDGWWLLLLLVVVVIYSGGGRACAARHGLTGDVVRRTNSICEYIQSKDCLFLSFSFAPVYLLSERRENNSSFVIFSRWWRNTCLEGGMRLRVRPMTGMSHDCGTASRVGVCRTQPKLKRPNSFEIGKCAAGLMAKQKHHHVIMYQ